LVRDAASKATIAAGNSVFGIGTPGSWYAANDYDHNTISTSAQRNQLVRGSAVTGTPIDSDARYLMRSMAKAKRANSNAAYAAPPGTKPWPEKPASYTCVNSIKPFHRR
jgi:hypothetical protein